MTKDNFTVTKINYFFKNDVYVGFGLIQDFLISSKTLKKKLDRFSYPCLLIQGLDDEIVNPKELIKIFRNLNTKDKNIKQIEGGFHELYADKEKDFIAEMMIDWILDRAEDRAINLGQVKNIKLKTEFKSTSLTFFSKTTLFFVYLFIIRYLLRIKKYRESRLRLLFFPLYWILKIFTIFFKRQSRGISYFLKRYKREIGI